MANTKEKKSPAKSKAKKPAKQKAVSKPRRAAPRKSAAKAKAPSTKTQTTLPVNAILPDTRFPEPVFAEQAMNSFGESLKAAVPAAVAVNSKLVELAHTNVSAGIELARDLAGAKTPMEMMRLGIAYWYDNMGVLQAQALELRTLSAALVNRASKPIRDQMLSR